MCVTNTWFCRHGNLYDNIYSPKKTCYELHLLILLFHLTFSSFMVIKHLIKVMISDLISCLHLTSILHVSTAISKESTHLHVKRAYLCRYSIYPWDIIKCYHTYFLFLSSLLNILMLDSCYAIWRNIHMKFVFYVIRKCLIYFLSKAFYINEFCMKDY